MSELFGILMLLQLATYSNKRRGDRLVPCPGLVVSGETKRSKLCLKELQDDACLHTLILLSSCMYSERFPVLMKGDEDTVLH